MSRLLNALSHHHITLHHLQYGALINELDELLQTHVSGGGDAVVAVHGHEHVLCPRALEMRYLQQQLRLRILHQLLIREEEQRAEHLRQRERPPLLRRASHLQRLLRPQLLSSCRLAHQTFLLCRELVL